MMNEVHQKVLDALIEIKETEGEYCYAGFKRLCEDTGLDRKQVRRSCRYLKRIGKAKFYAGLWDDDGKPRGSGYAAIR